MQKREYPFLQDSYLDSLKIINDIKFTPKELDVMACILSGRGRKATGSLLTIAEKTVETHIRNISQKLECNSQEAIREYLEKSNKFSAIRSHYLNLLAKATFEQHLQQISVLVKKSDITCSLTYGQGEVFQKLLVNQLEKHLILSGIQVTSKSKKNYKVKSPFFSFLQDNKTVYIFIISRTSLKDYQVEFTEEINRLAQKTSNSFIFLLENKETLPSTYRKEKYFEYIYYNEVQNYYYLFFDVLQRLTLNPALDKLTSSFKKQYIVSNETFEKAAPQNKKSPAVMSKIILSYLNIFLISFRQRKKSWCIGVGIICVAILSIFSSTFFNSKLDRKAAISEPMWLQAHLIIPTKRSYLNRPDLITQIETAFKGQHPIQTVALVGIGGAGKTTLARQYAQQQNSSFIWEINAETKESLSESFENLGVALSKTIEDQKVLQELKEIKEAAERETKLLQFVKKRLISLPKWFLIYDNVEKFSDINGYFPNNPMRWGTGKVIITTRNSTIQNSALVDHTILIPDLTAEQKLTLFLKIMGKANKDSPTFSIKENELLQQMPPFPLDVSIAACYLKITGISYERYMKHLKENNKNFYSVQRNILKEMGDYTKTRYGIISIPLEHIIKAGKDFKPLLVLISLLDSQEIPKDLLGLYKNDIVVENFIYHLRKYSLIANKELPSSLGPTFSIHRSTQEISTSYLIKKLNLQKNNKLLQDISNIIELYIIYVVGKEDTLRMKSLINHCKSFLSFDDILNEHIKSVIKSKLGAIYSHLGYYKQAESLLKKSLFNLDKEGRKNYAKVIWTLEHLGDVYNDIGKYEKARDLLEQSLSIYKKHFPNKYAGIAHVLERLGNVYDGMGNYEKARDLLEQSLTIYKKHFPDTHDGVARTLSRLANVYRDLGEFEKAKDFDEKSLAIYKQYFPENQLRIARQMAGLGNIYKYLGNYQKAKYFLEESLLIYKKELPQNHIYTTWAFIFLGNIYKKLGDYEKARELLEKNLIICEQHYGKDHIKNAEILRDLGEIYLLKKETKKGEKFLLKSLEILQRNNHPERYTSLEILADLYREKLVNEERRNNIEQLQLIKNKAIDYLRQALKVVDINFPKDSPHIHRLQLKLISLGEKIEEEKAKHVIK